MEDVSKVEIIKTGAKNGLILGFIHFIIFIGLYIADPTLVTGLLYLLIVIPLNILYPLFTGKKYRNEDFGGYWSFGNAFIYVFFVLLASGIFNLVTTGALSSLVMTEMPEALAEGQIKNAENIAKMFGAPQASIDQMQEDMDVDKIKENYTPLGMIKGFWLAMVFYAIGGLIVGLIIKKNEPIEDI